MKIALFIVGLFVAVIVAVAVYRATCDISDMKKAAIEDYQSHKDQFQKLAIYGKGLSSKYPQSRLVFTTYINRDGLYLDIESNAADSIKSGSYYEDYPITILPRLREMMLNIEAKTITIAQNQVRFHLLVGCSGKGLELINTNDERDSIVDKFWAIEYK